MGFPPLHHYRYTKHDDAENTLQAGEGYLGHNWSVVAYGGISWFELIRVR